MPSVICYARVSSDEQRRAETIQTQVEALRRYCAQHSIVAADWYLDDGIKGALELHERPEGARLLADARAGKVQTVLVYRVDRLGRGDDPRVTLNAVYNLQSAGARVISITEPFDATQPAGAFMLSMLAGASSYERASILQRSKDGTNRLAKEGCWLGGIVPYGYRVEGEKRNARLVEATGIIAPTELSEADVVRLIYRLTAEEHYTCQQIADYLNGLGVPTAYALAGRGRRGQRTANLWRPGRVRNMLVNPTYYGRHLYGKRSPHPGRQPIARDVPALVDEVIWRRAQEVLKEHILISPRNAKTVYLLRGLVVCGVCGLHYSGVPANGGRQYYYRCNGNLQYRGLYGNTGRRCPSRQAPGQWLDDYVWGQAERWLWQADETVAALAVRRGVRQDSSVLLLAEANRLEEQAKDKQAERDAILTLYRRGRIDEADLDRQMDAIAAEAAALRQRAADLRYRATQAKSAEEEVETAAALLAECRALLAAGVDATIKREILQALVQRVMVYTDFGNDGSKSIRVEVEAVLG